MIHVWQLDYRIFSELSQHYLAIFSEYILQGGDTTESIRIYDNIVKKAKEKKLSINSIEKKLGLGIGSICKWNSVSPTVKNLRAVAKTLECSIDDLLE